MLGGRRNDEINLWAVHGRSILDAIASTLELTEDALDVSRDILRRFGNMSSATITFVPQRRLLPRGRHRAPIGATAAPNTVVIDNATLAMFGPQEHGYHAEINRRDVKIIGSYLLGVGFTVLEPW